jgi:hypothetical protein
MKNFTMILIHCFINVLVMEVLNHIFILNLCKLVGFQTHVSIHPSS